MFCDSHRTGSRGRMKLLFIHTMRALQQPLFRRLVVINTIFVGFLLTCYYICMDQKKNKNEKKTRTGRHAYRIAHLNVSKFFHAYLRRSAELYNYYYCYYSNILKTIYLNIYKLDFSFTSSTYIIILYTRNNKLPKSRWSPVRSNCTVT